MRWTPAVPPITVALAVVGCSPAAPTTPGAQMSASASPAMPATDPATLRGAIQRCYGIPLPAPATPQFVAGTVTVYVGKRLKEPPLRVLDVQDNAEFTVSLPSGTYTIVGHWTDTNLGETPTRTVTIGAGTTTTLYLAYHGCK